MDKKGGGIVSNHTPGPWMVAGTDSKLEGWIVTNCKAGKMGIEYVATVYDETNANLIAAAPDMYDALRWLVNVSHGVSKGGEDVPVTDLEIREALKAAEQALQKAEGILKR